MNKKFNTPAIVLGMSVNGLGVVRSLAKHGIKVFALDAEASRSAMATRYATCLVCPDAKHYPNELKKFLFKLVEKYGQPAVLFPTSDLANSFIHQYRDDLLPNLMFALPPKPLMKKLIDKKGQYELTQKYNIPIPKTIIPKDINDLKSASSNFQYPILIKGLNTVLWREKFGDQKAIIVQNPSELEKQYQLLHEDKALECIIQEIIQGDDTRHYKICSYFDRNHKPLLTFTLQKIRQYPCDFGIGSTVISKWEPEVAALGLNFMRDMEYRGVGSIEFKKDLRDDRFKMIEINPRFWAQNSLAERCGQNFALTAYFDILGIPKDPQTNFQEGIKWIAFKEDRASFYGYHRQGRLHTFDWIKSILTGSRIWSTWVWHDPMPFLKEVKFGFALLEKIRNFLKRKFYSKKSLINQINKKDHHDNIKVEIIDNLDEFKNFKQDWQSIYQKIGIKNPFLSYEWIFSWWKGYSQDKNLLILKFSKGKIPIGCIPLMRYQTKLTNIQTDAIGFISNFWTRMDFLLYRHPENCIDKLCDIFNMFKQPVILSQLPHNSENILLLRQILKKKKMLFLEIPKYHAFVPMEGTWEEYFSKQSRNFRMDSRRKLKRLQKKNPVQFICDNGQDKKILQKIEIIANASWQAKKNVNILTTSHGKEFYLELLNFWKDQNIIDISVLQAGDVPIAYMVGLKHQGCYFAFDTAFDPKYQQFSPGIIMHNLLLERLFKEKFNFFDFGYHATYKSRWTSKKVKMIDFMIFPPGLESKLLFYGQILKKFGMKGYKIND